MSEIPEDVWRQADALLDRQCRETRDDLDVRLVAARAIIAERERCSAIAKRIWREAEFYSNEDARKAATLIRRRIDTGAAP